LTKGKTTLIHHFIRKAILIFESAKGFDCRDVFVTARRRAPDENIKFSKIFQFITICYLDHIFYTIGIIIMTIKEQFFSFMTPGGDEEVEHMFYSNGI
jgi:hypothetical protein